MKRNDGVALLIVLLVSILMFGIIGATLSFGNAMAKAAFERESDMICFYAAEAAVSRVVHQLATGEDGNVASVSFYDSVISAVTTEVEPDLYEVIAEGTYRDYTVRLQVFVDNRVVPLFSFAAFFEGDLEIQPGPNMTLSGAVHTNGDLYLGAGDTLTVDSDYLKSAGKMYLNRKDNGNPNTGDVQVKTGEDAWGDPEYASFEHDSDYFDWDNWHETIYNGIVEDNAAKAKIPPLEDFQANGYYHNEADVVIIDNTVYDGNGNIIGSVTETVIYDPREGKNVKVSEIDMATIPFPANGLLYAYRTGADENQPDGIRIINGSTIAGDLTIVTESPIYVKGDFNSVDKKNCAIISDAVNLLSNSYDDSGGTMQSASETTFNVSFVTGNVPTPDGGGNYSGGFENLPRFHENWSGTTCNLLGSFNCLFESTIAKGTWGSANVYSPPDRAWGFDLDLEDSDNLPPFTPVVRFTSVVAWLRL